MNKTIIFVVGILILIAAAGVIVLQSQNNSERNLPRQDAVVTPENQGVSTVEGYAGNLLAGKNSPYLEFQKNDYEKALQSGKIVFLNFYANWCPICRAETPAVQSAFNTLTTDQMVGFQVNFNDSDTDEDEKALAKEFGVTYQHTKVILKNGKQILKVTEQWDESQFLEALNNALE